MQDPTCFEIVHFAFQPGVTPGRQLEFMRQLDTWVRAQPGFISRQSFYEEKENRWTDLVAWQSADAAQDAMTRCEGAQELAPVMAAIDPARMTSGHYARRL